MTCCQTFYEIFSKGLLRIRVRHRLCCLDIRSAGDRDKQGAFMMKDRRSRWLLTTAFVTLSFVSARAQDETFQFDIAAEPLGQALTDLSQASSKPIILSESLVKGRTTGGLHGRYTVQRALDMLLADTDLKVSTNSAGVLMVQSKNVQAAPNEGAAELHTELETVIVTAQKRDERLRDTPVPVSVISGSVLSATNQLRLNDYYTQIPGLSVATNDYGAPQLAIRGVTTGGFTNPTVGIVVDDVPFGSSSALAHGQEAPDFDPSDLKQVEVLRGPQGTLYGASSLGGLIKYVTTDPSTDAFTGRVQAGVSGTQNGAEPGYDFRGAVNVPLTDTLAVRAGAFTRQDSGYINDPSLHLNGVNEGHATGGRLLALWKPSDDWTLKVSALVQHSDADGSSNVQPALGDLQQIAVRGAGGFVDNIQAYNANLTGHLGDIDVTSVTGYSVNAFSDTLDYTSAFAALTQIYFGTTGTPIVSNLKTKKFTQELRFSGTVFDRVDWMVGGFYNNEISSGIENIFAANNATGTTVGTWATIAFPSTFSEYAGFADLTYHVTDRFDIQLGGRESYNRQNYTETFTGLYDSVFAIGNSPVTYPRATTKDNSFTYLLTPRFQISPDLMVYVRLASGYRPGGPNQAVPGIPPHYNPDTTRNYEIGTKGDLFDGMITFDASLYYIDWKNIQLQLLDPKTFQDYYANGSAARSEGVELSAAAKPLTGMTASAWVAWNAAGLTQPLPITNAVGLDGARLPYSPQFSSTVSIDQEFPISEKLVASVGGSFSFVGNRLGQFTGTSQRQAFPSYTKLDLHAGVNYETVQINAFVNNVTDERGLLNGGIGTFVPTSYYYITPRTFGLSVVKNF